MSLGGRRGEWSPDDAWAPLAAGQTHDAVDAYAAPLAGCPVGRVDEVLGGFWAVCGHDEVVAAALATDTFSNVVPLFRTRRPPLECDPPEHQFYRRMLNRFFARDRMALLEPEIRRRAAELLEPLLADGAADFAARFAQSFPTRVLCLLPSLPDEDWRLINEWGEAVDRHGGQSAPGSGERIEAGEGIRPYMLELIAARRERPGDDRVSAIVGGDPELPPLDDDAVLGIVMLLSAGHNTTTSALGNLVLRLARDSSLQRRLRAEPALLPAAIEESLRIDAPQQAMRRIATQETELGGRRISEGEWAWLVFGAANLDERAFERPAVSTSTVGRTATSASAAASTCASGRRLPVSSSSSCSKSCLPAPAASSSPAQSHARPGRPRRLVASSSFLVTRRHPDRRSSR